jgi:hypothetical protein
MPAASTPAPASAAQPFHSKICIGNAAAFNSKGFWDTHDWKLSLPCRNWDVWLMNIVLYLGLIGFVWAIYRGKKIWLDFMYYIPLDCLKSMYLQ